MFFPLKKHCLLSDLCDNVKRFGEINSFVFEVSLIIIIYAGFRFEMIKGLLLAFYLGFILDLIGGSVPGVLALAYIMIFLCSFFISDLLDTGKNHVIVLFSFICVFLKDAELLTDS